MKMEMGVFAPEAGRIKEILCRPNQQASIAQPLILMESEGESDEVDNTQETLTPLPRPYQRLFANDKADPRRMDHFSDREADTVVQDLCSILRSMTLGYDVCKNLLQHVDQLFAQHQAFRTLKKPQRWAPLLQFLEMFADCSIPLDRNLFLEITGAPSIPADICFYDFC